MMTKILTTKEVNRMTNIKRIITASIVGASLISLAGCQTAGTYIDHKDLSVQSKMSETIFLDPVKNNNVYLQIKNTTQEDLDLKDLIVKNLEKDGWNVTSDYDKAYTTLQISVLQAGPAESPENAFMEVMKGFGGPAASGIGAMAAMAAYGGSNFRTAGEVGLSAGAADYVGSKVVKDKTYSVITDIQVGRKVDGQVKRQTNDNNKAGAQGVTTENYVESSNWLHYNTRVGTVADQVNLKFADAKPTIENQLAKEIAGILG